MWQPMQERCYINLIPWPRSRMRRLQHVYTVRFKWSENAQIMRFLRVRILILIKKIKKIKKMLAFCWNMLYSIFCWRVNEMRTMRSVGQAAKTSPSHGENRGSIPLRTAFNRSLHGSVFCCADFFLPIINASKKARQFSAGLFLFSDNSFILRRS